MSVSRRDFLKAGALVAATASAMGAASIVGERSNSGFEPSGKDTIRDLDALSTLERKDEEDILIRMQRDLVRAMRKPVEERKWAMLIDTRKCVGCHACTIGCIAENKLPPGVVYRPVMSKEKGSFPNVSLEFLPRPCMHCEHPSCVPVCPVKATWKRPDGVVVVNYDKCIGCRHCLTACPYGARTSDFGESYASGAAHGAPSGLERPVQGKVSSWEEKPSHEYCKEWDRSHHNSPVGNARKCHFCLHRLEEGKLPMCVTTCIGRATYFGDMNDETSLIAIVAGANKTYKLLPHSGNEPCVLYV